MSRKAEVMTLENGTSESAFESKEGVHPSNVQDGDIALNVLHSHFEPFTKEEEKKVLRKIDVRLALLMLLVNGIQFVDKLVRHSYFMYLIFGNADILRRYHKLRHTDSSQKLISRARSFHYSSAFSISATWSLNILQTF